jgi:hypothetical protein
MLTGCLSASPRIVSVTPQPVAIKPERPSPIRLVDENFIPCVYNQQDMICLTPNNAQALIENKVKIGRWMGQANNVIDYYEFNIDRVPIPTPKPEKNI